MPLSVRCENLRVAAYELHELQGDRALSEVANEDMPRVNTKVL